MQRFPMNTNLRSGSLTHQKSNPSPTGRPSGKHSSGLIKRSDHKTKKRQRRRERRRRNRRSSRLRARIRLAGRKKSKFGDCKKQSRLASEES